MILAPDNICPSLFLRINCLRLIVRLPPSTVFPLSYTMIHSPFSINRSTDLQPVTFNQDSFVWKVFKKCAQITRRTSAKRAQPPSASLRASRSPFSTFSVSHSPFTIHYSRFPIHHSPFSMIHSPFNHHLNRGSNPPPYPPSSFLLFSKTPYIGRQFKSPPSTNCLNIIEPRFEPRTPRGKGKLAFPFVTRCDPLW
jgi:hypothetical protein